MRLLRRTCPPSTNFATWSDAMKDKPVWDKARPKDLGAPKKLTPAKKTAAKAEAKRKGQVYPSLVANMRAAKSK